MREDLLLLVAPFSHYFCLRDDSRIPKRNRLRFTVCERRMTPHHSSGPPYDLVQELDRKCIFGSDIVVRTKQTEGPKWPSNHLIRGPLQLGQSFLSAVCCL